jgi:hypothetical protein
MTARWLNQRWDDIHTGYAYDLCDSMQRVFNPRE